MQLYLKLINKKAKLAVVGLGYTGLPIALAFAKKVNVIGFDILAKKMKKNRKGLEFTTDPLKLREAMFYIIAVPTPVFSDNTPNLDMVKQASKTVGQSLQKGSIVVYESTVYPGVTEDICIPILEEASGLKCGKDFKVGYCPERVNVADKKHQFENITKVVAGIDRNTTNEIAKVYSLVILTDIYKAPSIKVAEAAKVIENCQRDINVAFMNEIAIIFNKLKIDTKEVLETAGTKWNFLNFKPGLVGGHCISIDPYYLIYKASKVGINSSLLSTGRKINEDMSQFITDVCIQKLNEISKKITDTKVAILGCSFKENCDDVRNSKVFDIQKKLKAKGAKVFITDPKASLEEVKKNYNIVLTDINDLNEIDALIVAVAHDEYKKLKIEDMDKFYGSSQKILIDIPGIYNKDKYEKAGYKYWRL